MGLLLLAALLSGATALAATGPKAPPLAGADVVTGKRVGLAAHRGRPVLIPVWSSY